MNKKSILFKNNTIIYSILLIVFVTAIIFFNTYYFVGKFQNITDKLLQEKAILVEDIISIMIDDVDDIAEVEAEIMEISKKDDEILDISILQISEDNKKFHRVTSIHEEKIDTTDEINFLAWRNEEGIAILNQDQGERYWRVVKVMQEGEEKVALIELKVSLLNSDKFIDAAIRQIYIVTIIALIILLLLIANHIRMFQYVLKSNRLEELDEMKDSFIAMASHELKSPLTAIRGYAELLKDSLSQDKRIKEGESMKENLRYINNIDVSSQRLTALVEDILEVSRIEQGNLTMDIAQINLTEIATRTIEQLTNNANKKGLKITSELGNTPVMAQGDYGRVQQIIINLVSNAIKYTPEGSVRILTKEDKKNIYIIVEDTGMGISADGMKHLFSKFYRIKNEKTDKISGTGLGLWISRELARQMHGDLTVESMEGVGSHFILKLKKEV